MNKYRGKRFIYGDHEEYMVYYGDEEEPRADYSIEFDANNYVEGYVIKLESAKL